MCYIIIVIFSLCYMRKVCKNRFFGDNCSTKIPAMYFGPGCLLQCNCTKEQCHHFIGCSSSVQSSSKGARWTLLTVPLTTYKYILRMYILNTIENNIEKTMHVPCRILSFKTIIFVYNVLNMYGKKSELDF